jgi:hypothetical protein
MSTFTTGATRCGPMTRSPTEPHPFPKGSSFVRERSKLFSRPSRSPSLGCSRQIVVRQLALLRLLGRRPADGRSARGSARLPRRAWQARPACRHRRPLSVLHAAVSASGRLDTQPITPHRRPRPSSAIRLAASWAAKGSSPARISPAVLWPGVRGRCGRARRRARSARATRVKARRPGQRPPAHHVMMIGLGVNVMFGLLTREKLPAKSNTSSPLMLL